MRYFRRLPPRLRTKCDLEWVFLLAGFVFVMAVNLTFFYRPSPDAGRMAIIAANLGILCFVCAFAVRLYRTRFRQQDGGPLPLRSWQRLTGSIAPVALPPICGIALTLTIPLTSRAFEVVFLLSLIGMVVLLVAYFSTYLRRRAAD